MRLTNKEKKKKKAQVVTNLPIATANYSQILKLPKDLPVERQKLHASLTVPSNQT